MSHLNVQSVKTLVNTPYKSNYTELICTFCKLLCKATLVIELRRNPVEIVWKDHISQPTRISLL
jgi:hypothetical protein